MGKAEVKGSRSRSILTDKEKRCFLTGRREGLDKQQISGSFARDGVLDHRGVAPKRGRSAKEVSGLFDQREKRNISIYHGTALRKISDRHGFWCYLWQPYHLAGLGGLHAHPNRGVDLELKMICQRKFEESHSREEFMAIIGRNYLDKEEEIPVRNEDGFWRLKDTWEFDGERWD